MLDASKKGWSSELKGVSLKASIKTPVVVLLVAVFALCFAAMLSLSLVDRIAWHSDEIWLVVLPAVLAILVAVLFMKKIEMGILMNVSLVIIASALSLSSFFSVSPTVLFAISTNGLALTIFLTILFMIALAKKLECSPYEMGVQSVFSVFIGCLAGRFFAEIAVEHFSSAGMAISGISTVCIIVIVICVSTSLNNTSLKVIMRYEFNEHVEDEEFKQKAEEKRLKALADSKGLGEREFEAFCLLLGGCSASEVADKMFIANGTAKAHIRHIYQKFGVSDREGLFTMASQVKQGKQTIF